MKIEKLIVESGSFEQRDTKEDMYENILEAIRNRSSCPRGKRHAAIVINNGRIIATGYNGPASGIAHCKPCTLTSDALGKDWRTCIAVHAEENVVANAARYGTAINDCDLIITKKPCQRCELLLINAGIKTVYYLED